jgi:DNA-binding NarL/FixJ family response regulator
MMVESTTGATNAIRIAIADDHTLMREGLKALLQLYAGMFVVAEIDDAAELSAQLLRTPCDVLLIDRDFLRDGHADVRKLSEATKVLLVCEDLDECGEAVNALRAGARGVVFERCTVESLIEAIRTVAAGQVWMSPELQSRVAETLHEDPSARLTLREREIVRQVALGLRNGEIATVLFISEQTVKTHLSRIFRKIHVRDRIALTLYASRLGLAGARGQRP